MKKELLSKNINGWKILEYLGKDRFGQDIYLCECSCGKRKAKNIYELKRGKSKCCRSCSAKKRKTIYSNIKNTKEYKRLKNIYSTMKQRCYNKNNPKYKNYGKKGISICPLWLDEKTGFLNFYNWSIKNGYSYNLSIDRIDYTKGYSPENCRWVSMKIQQNNKSNNVWLFYNGEKITLKNFCIKYKLNEKTVRQRYNRFHIKDPNKLILKKIEQRRKRKYYATINGITKPITDWCKEIGLNRESVASRIKKYGYTPEDAILKPLKNGTETEKIKTARYSFLKNYTLHQGQDQKPNQRYF